MSFLLTNQIKPLLKYIDKRVTFQMSIGATRGNVLSTSLKRKAYSGFNYKSLVKTNLLVFTPSVDLTLTKNVPFAIFKFL